MRFSMAAFKTLMGDLPALLELVLTTILVPVGLEPLVFRLPDMSFSWF